MEEEVKNKINDEVEKQIKEIVNEGIQAENVNMLYKLVDIHKDLANEDYWCEKKEVMKMRYRTGDYRDEYSDGSYGRRGVPGTGRGRYRGDSYGRRGVPGTGRGRYRGEDMLEEMQEHYGNYMENGGSYGGPETDKAFDYMLEAAEDFMNHLMEESDSPEQMEKIKRLAKRIAEKRM